MLRGVFVGWIEAADAIIAAMDKAFGGTTTSGAFP